MACITRGRTRLLMIALLVFGTVSSPAFALNCVQYVRKVSGMDISGNGWQWWENASGVYERGHTPKENAIMVFDHTPSMEHGHVAIVSKILNSRLITVNHANWAHLRSLKGHVNTGVMVQDVSDRNDWSSVRVMDQGTQSYGRENPVLGFVYNKPGQGAMVADNLNLDDDAPTSIKDVDNE
jgi:hypothetical protein